MFKHTISYLQGLKSIVNEKDALTRLKFLPQRVENGVLINFNNKGIFKDTQIGEDDCIIFDKDTVNNASRCTDALINKYFDALDSFLSNCSINDNSGEAVNVSSNKIVIDPIYELLYTAIENKDKKEVKKLCEDLENKWFALDPDIVEDAIFDIMACVKAGDVDEVKAIIKEVEGEDLPADIVGSVAKTIVKEVCEDAARKAIKETITKPFIEENYQPKDETEEDLLADLDDAIKDEDVEDIEMLLKELGEKHPLYSKYHKIYLTLQDGADKKDTSSEDDEIEEILADLDDALEAGELDGKDGAIAILEELKDIVGEDDADYKKYYDLVYPPKKETRTSRRRGK